MEIILALATILGGITAIWFFGDKFLLFIQNISYSQTFRVKGPNKAKEKYLVTEKIEFRKKDGCDDSSRVVLVKSSEPNAQGFFDISIGNNKEIYFNRYSFIHSFNHNWTAPGKTLLKETENWCEKAPSNDFKGFELDSHLIEDSSILKRLSLEYTNVRIIKTNFKYPKTYTGPRYKNRILIFAMGIGLVYSETTYMNSERDIYRLNKFKIVDSEKSWFPVKSLGNWWVYDIEYQHGSNKINLCS